MNTTRTCPQCGKPVADNALQGLCPECMMKVGLAAQTGETVPDDSQAFKSWAKPPPTPAEVAKLFPQLEILECLGSGGMGAVYKARQPRLDRLVALKILTREEGVGDARFAARFEREARALAKLNHPNIVAIYEFGQEGGLPFFIMEYVDGLSLRQLERAGQLRPSEALQIIPQICEALQFAHAEGIVHRDIKPENILMDKKGRVKIADFGIAKILGRAPGDHTLTQTSQAIGTPHYMAPEQVEKPQIVDHRADIYSLGVVFYEMLTGELPLGKFALPSSKVRVDVRLDEVVLHALEKEPERRYQHANEVKTDVETIVSSPGEAVRPAAVAGQTNTQPANQSPFVRIVEIACGLTFKSPVALKLLNLSTIGFLGALAFLGYVPLPGWERCFALSGFSGFFGLIGLAYFVEFSSQRRAKATTRPGGTASTPESKRPRGRVQWQAIGLLTIGIVSWIGIALFVLLPGASQNNGLRSILLLLAPLAAMMVVLLRRKLRKVRIPQKRLQPGGSANDVENR